MKHGSLFSGGGGFDLAAEHMGWKNVFHCEKDPFCQTILKHYWPEAETISDIKEFDAKKYKGKIDIITGGFPCQPFSAAGKRKGTADDRYLWPDMLRVIRQIRPVWVVGENVFGLINWNEGMVFKKVLLDLEAEGYKVWPYVLPAAGVGAPHQRYRVFVIAYHPRYAAKRQKEGYSYAGSAGRGSAKSGSKAKKGRNIRKLQYAHGLCASQLEKAHSDADLYGHDRGHRPNEEQPDQTRQYAQRDPKPVGKHASHASCKRSKLETQDKELEGQRPVFTGAGADWQHWPTQPPLCGRDDGLPAELDGITFSKWKAQSIKMYGNAVVPPLVVKIFKVIEQYECLKKRNAG